MTPRPLVDAPAGLIRAVRCDVASGDRNETAVLVARGIPYAEAPVGPLRLRPPRPKRPWSGELDAVAFGSRAIQAPSMLAPPGEAQSEDCLFLNVWAPESPGLSLPVMVWFHGGGFTGGSASLTWYDATNLARRGVVVVTVNYRLGPLGFLHLEPIGGAQWAGSANLGLADQSMALQWVRDNIEAFGGDATRVTIFGESAGAMSVSAHVALPSSRGRYRTAIAQSGSATHVQTAERAERTARGVLASIGLDPSHLDRLSDIPTTAFIEAATSVDRGGDGLPLAFQPTVDGTSLPRSPIDALRAGEGADLSFVVGTNADEMLLFTAMAQMARGPSAPLDDDRLAARIAAFAAASGRVADPAVVRAAYAESLANEHDREAGNREIWNAVLTDLVFAVPAAETIDAQVAGGGAALAYLFTRPSTAFDGMLGAAHATEIPFVFDNLDQHGVGFLLGEIDDTDRVLAGRMADDWVAIATSGRAPWSRTGESRPTMVYGRAVDETEDPRRHRRQVWMGEPGR